MPRVALVKCESYDFNEVKEALTCGVESIGGLDSCIQPHASVFLKPNMLAAEPPEICATTHPSVFKAVSELVRERHTHTGYGDSGEDPDTITINRTGMQQAASQSGITHIPFKSGHTEQFPDGTQYRNFFIADALDHYDSCISIPKFKTHALEFITCCVKNQYGCIPGKLKRELHYRIPDPINFAKYLLDLNRCLSPQLYVVDAVMTMEGNGPRHGTPKFFGCIAVGTDPVAIDATLCRIASIDPSLVPTVYLADEFNAGSWREKEITYTCAKPADFKTSPVELVTTPHMLHNAKGLFKLIYPLFAPRPAIDPGTCTRCGGCVEVCPSKPRTLTQTDKRQPPVFHYSHCIRCFCCQEYCPYGAIYVKKTLLYTMLKLLIQLRGFIKQTVRKRRRGL